MENFLWIVAGLFIYYVSRKYVDREDGRMYEALSCEKPDLCELEEILGGGFDHFSIRLDFEKMQLAITRASFPTEWKDVYMLIWDSSESSLKWKILDSSEKTYGTDDSYHFVMQGLLNTEDIVKSAKKSYEFGFLIDKEVYPSLESYLSKEISNYKKVVIRHDIPEEVRDHVEHKYNLYMNTKKAA